MAGSEGDSSFLAGGAGTESQGTFSKEVSDCRDSGLGERLGEDGAEMSIGMSPFCMSFWGESGLSRSE